MPSHHYGVRRRVTERINGDHLTGFEAVDNPESERYGSFTTKGKKKGSITINIGLIEDKAKTPTRGPEWREGQTRETVAHERIHLADWAENSEFDWIISLENHHGIYGYLDRTSRWGSFMGERAGRIFPQLGWSRMCLDDQVSYFLSGWGHHNEIRDGYCIVRGVLQGGR